MKTLDDAVIELSGVWPSMIDYMTKFEGQNDWRCARSPENGLYICTRDQFQQRAKELGFVGKYRWGVEYPANGKKPDLADDVVVCIENGTMRDSVDGWDWPLIESFRITDQRYKPADTSYLDKQPKLFEFTPIRVDADIDIEFDDGSDWYCYETQKALRLPTVGTVCLVWFDDGKECWQKCKVLAMSPYEHDHMAVSLIGCYDRKLVWSQDFKPLDWNRKAEAEKKRVVDAVWEAYHEFGDLSVRATFDALYDAGYLRLPANKD
jgi:hypothetical protein